MIRITENNVLLRYAALVVLPFFCAFSRAQTVGVEIAIRNTTIPGSVSEATAVFESGATYVTWRDTRTEGVGGGDIYVQKLGADGQPLWDPNGLPLCLTTNAQSLPAITTDGAGGAVVSWLDELPTVRRIFAQRIAVAGAVQWAASGVFVGYSYSEFPFSYVHRGAGGTFPITWWDSSPSALLDVYPILAQKLDANGTPLWDPDDPTGQDRWGPGIEALDGITRGRSVSDGAGGFIAIGKIRKEGGFRFQRFLADDSTAWPKPVDFVDSLPDTASYNFASDGAGGVVVAFLENRDVRAFRVAADGSLPWGNSGVTLVQANALLGDPPFVAPNGTGGAFVAWIASTPHDVRVQQIASDGSILWAAGGAIVPDGSSSEREPALIRDGAGGIFLSFTTATSLRGQRLNSDGNAQWKTGASNGVGLGAGELSIIGAGNSGPLVIYKRGTGLFAKAISVSAPFQLTNIVLLANNQVSLGLSGGVPGRTYEILRTPTLAPLSNNAWTVVGTVQPGQTWTNTSPLTLRGFYAARDVVP